MEIKYNETLRETLHVNRLSSGLTCYVLPKKGYVEKQAVIAVNYGSIDQSFTLGGRRYDTPEGIAHFLEHKLFEDENRNIFEVFNQKGAAVNAFTNQTNTAYYFNCIDNFDENFRLLLDFTQNPFFTVENVEKEKDIIAQEINMYRDNPFWRGYFNMLRLMYGDSALGKEIAGDVSSIRRITKEHLYECYNAFYYPANMALICVGDIEPERIYEMTEEMIRPEATGNRGKGEILRHYGSYEAVARENSVEDKMPLSLPMYSLGFKDEAGGNPADRMAVTRMLLEIFSGESSDLYGELYGEGLIDSSFSAEYAGGPFFGASIFSGTSRSPEEVRDRLIRQIQSLKSQGLPKDRFERIKKKQEGRFIRIFNTVDALATGQVDLFSKGIDWFDFLQSVQNVSYEAVSERLNSHLREDNFVFSVVSPM